MTDPPVKKQRRPAAKKNKTFQWTGNRQQVFEIGQKGFLATCNNNERNCIRECYNVLKQYADELYGPEEKPEKKKKKKKGAPKSDEDEKKTEETDISDDLKKEIEEARAEAEFKRRRFQAVDTGTKNCVFIKTTLPDPVELGVKLVKDIAEKNLKKSRFLLRLIPIEVVCRATVDEIAKASAPMFDKHFLGEGKTFSVVYNKRYNKDIKRDVVIKTLADKVLEMNPKNKVDLKNPELSIITEIVKGKCCLSIVEGYLKYRRYNLVELGIEKEENGAAKKEGEDSSEKTEDNDSGEKADDKDDKPKEETVAGKEEKATENDSIPEDVVRDVPVGKKLKELLERKKSTGDEPSAKKSKDDPEDIAKGEDSDKEEEPTAKKFKDDPEEKAAVQDAEEPENGAEPAPKKFKEDAGEADKPDNGAESDVKEAAEKPDGE